jgi:septal ring factor EnvC (AmiA/AmiB activator)
MPIAARCSRPLCASAFAVLGALFLAQPAQAQQTSSDKAKAEQQLTDVHSRMQALTRQQAETSSRRDAINTELERRAKALASAARALRETDGALAAKQHDLEQLQQQRQDLQQKLDLQRAAIAELLRATYALGRGSDLRLLLGDEDVERIARALAYSKYFQQDRLQRVQQLMADLARLQDLETAITAQQQALQATRAQRAEQSKSLAEKRSAQQKLAREIDATYQDEHQRLAALKDNERALNQLVDRLQKAIDEAARQAAREAERAAREHPSSRPGTPIGKALANIRGNLPWPASGAVNTYGNGVLIKAAGGSEVHAVARGRVVFANFLRGYGMLLILDHGNGWMSMYGDNESLVHHVGDTVDAGETVGTASAPTGANTGTYFELRHNHQPVDPRSWLGRQR